MAELLSGGEDGKALGSIGTAIAYYIAEMNEVRMEKKR